MEMKALQQRVYIAMSQRPYTQAQSLLKKMQHLDPNNKDIAKQINLLKQKTKVI